jgi:Zn-dependent oligopeptidase
LIESFNTTDDVDTEQIVDNKVTLLEFLTKEEVNTAEVETDVLKEFKEQDTETRALAYRILLEKFNDKYSDLSSEQKKVLKEFIESENSGVKLRDFYNEKITEIKKTLATEIAKVDNEVIKIKLQEVLKYVVEIDKTKKVDNDNIVDLLEYYELIKEIKSSHG